MTRAVTRIEDFVTPLLEPGSYMVGFRLHKLVEQVLADYEVERSAGVRTCETCDATLAPVYVACPRCNS